MTDITSLLTEPEGPHPECPYLYQYDSLEDKPSRTIRLLTIDHDGDNGAPEPSKPCDNYRESDRSKHACGDTLNPKKLKVSLHEACLDDSPEYEAVSYAWGSAKLVQQVACDSKWLWVTQSCYGLLNELRKRDGRGARRYWIDAICINQGFQEENTPDQRSQRERSHQVAMMATIYEKAVEVIVWPGYVQGSKDHLEIFFSSALRDVPEQAIPPLRSLIQQPYFTRIWPLQEIALARRCIILVGAVSPLDIRLVFLMPNPTLRRQYLGVRDFAELVSLRQQYERVTALHRQLLGYFESRRENPNTNPRPKIPPLVSEILLHARSHQASEPRDKVFALYGILQRLQAHLEAPNYPRPTEDIYSEASAAAIYGDQSLRVFEGLTGVSSLELPGWSPDWSDHQHITKVAEWTDYKASGSSEAQPSIQGRELLIRGLLVDVVCQEHISFVATSFLGEGNTLAENLAEPLRDPSIVPVEAYLNLLEMLFLGIWENEDVRSPRDYAHWTWVQNDAKRRTAKKTVCRLIVYRNDKEFTEGVIKRSFILHADLCRRLDRKKLFQTRDGRLGIASRSIKSGDSIVLLQGCNLPMVDHPEGTKWKLIAPAYLPADGIMEGNLWKPDGPLSCFSFV